MQAGDLDQQVTLRHRALRGDGSGGATNTPAAYATGIWAKVEPLRGTERDKASRVEAVSGYLVTIRHRSDVVEGDTLVWGSRTLNVTFVRDAGARAQWLGIECDKGAAV